MGNPIIKPDDPLFGEIVGLLNRGYEGGYWDYKSDYPDTAEEKLHDIICMANNLENRDAYLIYGAEDDGTVCGIETTMKTRQDTKSLVEFLRAKPFAGGFVPTVDVKTMHYQNHQIDVVTIYLSYHTPFYLTEEFGKTPILNDRLKAGSIYTRTENVNTPRYSTAKFGHTEYLWRKRFGIDRPPFERFNLLLLETGNWSETNWDILRHSYHKIHPEFQIVVGESQEGYENLRYFYDNERMFYAPLKLQYLSTTLHETTMYYMDEGRCVLPMPSRKVVFSKYLYYYFRLDTIEGHLFHCITSGKCVCHDRTGLSVPVLVFKNESEEQAFQAYMDNEEIIEAARKRLNDSAIFQHIKAKEQRDGIPAIGNVTSVAICFEAYKKWREDYAD